MKLFNLISVASAIIAVNAHANVFPKHMVGDFTSITSKVTSEISAPNTLQPMITSSVTGSHEMAYYGGPVISHVQIYLILWGDQVSQNTQSEMPGFYSSMVNSSYMDFLKIYNTTNVKVEGGTHASTDQTVGRGSFMQTIQISPVKLRGKIDDAEIQAELEKQILAGKIPAVTPDSLFMIHFPKGLSITMHDGNSVATSCVQFCAYHNGFKTATGTSVYYGVIPNLDGFMCRLGCGGFFSSALTRATVSASHEMMEAITDPFPTPGNTPGYPQAWNTKDGAEIGDLCQGSNGTLKGGAKDYIVQQEWDQSHSACTTGDYVSK